MRYIVPVKGSGSALPSRIRAYGQTFGWSSWTFVKEMIVTLLATRKRSLQVRGIERRHKLLAAARALLASHDLDELSLGDVAAAASVPKGSAYHFYGDIKDLYSSLLVSIEEEMLIEHRAAIDPPPRAWQDVMRVMISRGAAYYTADAGAQQLLIGPKTPPDLKIQDRRNDLTLGQVFEEQIGAFFELPRLRDRPKVFFLALEIVDLMFSLSVLEHGHITGEMREEAIRASIAYLESYLPKRLPKRRRARAVQVR